MAQKGLRRHRYWRDGEFFALCQGLLPFGRRPLLLLDIEWYSAQRSGWRGRLKRWLHQRMAVGADLIQVFCRVEAANYAARFGIPRRSLSGYLTVSPRRIQAVPAKAVSPFQAVCITGITTTLFAAVEGLPLELQVAAPRSHFAQISTPSNVTILGVISADDTGRRCARPGSSYCLSNRD